MVGQWLISFCSLLVRKLYWANSCHCCYGPASSFPTLLCCSHFSNRRSMRVYQRFRAKPWVKRLINVYRFGEFSRISMSDLWSSKPISFAFSPPCLDASGCFWPEGTWLLRQGWCMWWYNGRLTDIILILQNRATQYTVVRFSMSNQYSYSTITDYWSRTMIQCKLSSQPSLPEVADSLLAQTGPSRETIIGSRNFVHYPLAIVMLGRVTVLCSSNTLKYALACASAHLVKSGGIKSKLQSCT